MLLHNQIYCGDCLDILKLADNESVDLVITDPPYGMSFRSNYRKEKYEHIANDDGVDWVWDMVSLLDRVMKPNTHLYWFCSFHNVDVFKQSLEKFFTIKNILIWEKNNTGMGDLTGSYAPKYEMIIFAQKGRRLLNGRRDPDILHFNRTGNVNHPTEKPVDLLEYLVSKSSHEGDVVLDPFIGSGSTAVACKRTLRDFIGIEIDPDFCKKAKERLNENNLEV
jgi:site-specific DNA-methyltransferase (adenine-specific)